MSNTTIYAMTLSGLMCLSLFGGEVDLSSLEVDGLHHVSVGVTRSGRTIPAVVTSESVNVLSSKVRVLLIGGLNGSADTTDAAIDVVRRYYTDEKYAPMRKEIDLAAVVCGNPDGFAQGIRDDNGLGSDPTIGFPPAGECYTGAKNAESQYLWRWIGILGPDVVIVLVDGQRSGAVDGSSLPAGHLVNALNKERPGGIGSIEAVAWSVAPGDKKPFAQVADALLTVPDLKAVLAARNLVSSAHQELKRRAARTPLEVCKLLSEVYGRDLPSTAYIPSVAVIARMRYGEFIGESQFLRDAMQLTEPYRVGEVQPLTTKSGASDIAGQILFAELARRTDDVAYKKLVLSAADHAFDDSGKPLAAMPGHSEMSDSTFMSCPILAAAGKLSGDDKYFQMCVRHMLFMQKMNLRSDGLHRHSPLDETAWGRGNGFPALGLALVLSDMPPDHPERPKVLTAFREHVTALLPHQDVTGAWHQVIDHPESYRELTATCMITFAMARGLQRGWIDDARFKTAVERGWSAINLRIADDGVLTDVCTGTGKMKSLRDYLDRPAILGKDSRGGAMAFLVAVELASGNVLSK